MLSPEREALILERVRNNLIDYAIATTPGFIATKFHRMLAAILQSAFEGKYQGKIVVVHCHPRIGKSNLISKTFPAWALGNKPNLKTIIASNSMDLASEFTLALREKMTSELHVKAFGDAATLGSRARADSFLLNGGGSIIATSMTATIVGQGSNILILDDPVTTWADVSTQSYRDQQWLKFTELYTRLDHGFKCVIIVMQRWHSDDLVGRLLRDMKDLVVQYKFPALIETDDDKKFDSMGRDFGEVVAPELFTVQDMLHIKRVQSAAAWAAQYQGRPLNVGGGRFLDSYIKREDVDPEWAKANMTLYLVGDPASAKNADADYSAFFVIGLNADGRYFILDGVREKLSLNERWIKFRDLWLKWRPLDTWYEAYGASADIEYFRERMDAEKCFFSVKNLAYLNHSGTKRATGDIGQKHARIERLIPDMIEGKWVALKQIQRFRIREDGSQEAYDPVDEMIRDEFPDFPSADHDDCLDTLSRMMEIPKVWPSGTSRTNVKIKSFASPF